MHMRHMQLGLWRLAGKHVLSELLPTQNLAEAVQLCEAVERSGKVYQYAENYCFFEPVFEMRRRFERGDIGEATAMEATFINDLSAQWPRLTRGERNNWRNHVPSTFYCTHSIGPMLYITGRRAVNVVGIEIPVQDCMKWMGACSGSAACQLMQLDNGGMAKSLHGNLKRTFTSHYSIYGTKGSMETDKYDYRRLHVSIEKPFEENIRFGRYNVEDYIPSAFEESKKELRKSSYPELGNSDYYITKFFFGAINGDETAKHYGIDIYHALDMSLPGLFAYRSILNGSIPMVVPDLRDKAIREELRYDTACTDPLVAGNLLQPSSKFGSCMISDEVYARCADLFRRGETD